jgi:hypothetical protein
MLPRLAQFVRYLITAPSVACRHLGVRNAPADGARRHEAVVQPGYRDAKRNPGRHPAADEQLRDVPASQLGGERPGPRRTIFGPHGCADHSELDRGDREAIAQGLGDLERGAHDAVTAKIRGLAAHPVDGRPVPVV